MKHAGGRGAKGAPATAVGDGTLPRKSCVICTTPRTGSWLLAEALLATGLAGRPEEYLRPDWFAHFLEAGGLEYEHRLDHWPTSRNGGRTTGTVQTRPRPVREASGIRTSGRSSQRSDQPAR